MDPEIAEQSGMQVRLLQGGGESDACPVSCIPIGATDIKRVNVSAPSGVWPNSPVFRSKLAKSTVRNGPPSDAETPPRDF